MSEPRVLATPAGPYVVNCDLDVWNAEKRERSYPKPGDVITFEPGDMVDVESLLAIGALLEPKPTEHTDEALTAAVHEKVEEAEANAEASQAAREARVTAQRRAERGR